MIIDDKWGDSIFHIGVLVLCRNYDDTGGDPISHIGVLVLCGNYDDTGDPTSHIDVLGTVSKVLFRRGDPTSHRCQQCCCLVVKPSKALQTQGMLNGKQKWQRVAGKRLRLLVEERKCLVRPGADCIKWFHQTWSGLHEDVWSDLEPAA